MPRVRAIRIISVTLTAATMLMAAAWPQTPTGAPSPEAQVLQRIQQLQQILNLRNAAKVPVTSDPFSTQFHATNARCQAYLTKLKTFAAARGQLTDAFVATLSADEVALLRQDESNILAAVDCPLVKPGTAANIAGQPPSAPAQPPANTSGTQTPANPPAGQQPTPPANAQGTPQTPVTAPGTPQTGGNNQAVAAQEGGDITGGNQTIYIAPQIENYQVRLIDQNINVNTVDLDGTNLPLEHGKTGGGKLSPHVVILKLQTQPDPNNPKQIVLSLTGMQNSPLLQLDKPVVLHVSGLDSKTSAPVVKTATIQAVSIDTFHFPSESFIKPTQLHFLFDIVRLSSETGAKGQCSNRAYSQDAQIWQTIIRLRPTTAQDTGSPQDGIFVYKGNTPGIRYLAVFDDFQPTASLPVGARAFDGALTRMLSGELRVTFANRSLTETSDLLKELSSHSDVVMSRIAVSLGKISVYQIATDPSLDIRLEDTLFTFLERQQAAGNNLGKIGSIPSPAVVVTSQGTTLPLIIKSVGQIDVASLKPVPGDIAPLNDAIKKLANLGTGTESSDTKRNRIQNAATQQNPSGKSLTTTGDVTAGQKQQVILIQDNCVEVSVQPNLSGSDFQPSVFFKGHYDYVTAGNYFVFKNYAEAEGSGTSADFQRLAFSSEGMTLRAPTGKGWTFNGGVVGRFNRSLKVVEINEWQAGGKFVIQTPFISIPGASAGANTKPTIDADAVASSNDLANQNTNFLAHVNFTYSYRTGRFTVDAQSNNGWSNQRYFAGRSQYSYALLQMRFNLKDNLDYSAKYECGRKPPNYLKFCGWKTGFSFVTGR